MEPNETSPTDAREQALAARLDARTAREHARANRALEAAERALVHERRTQARQQRKALTEQQRAARIAAGIPTTKERGDAAEERAVAALEAAGYVIAATKWSCKAGELDIVAYDGATLVFVEVRSRDNAEHGTAAEMVNRKKQHQVTRIAKIFLERERPDADAMRFDVVAITGDELEIFVDAWRGGLAP